VLLVLSYGRLRGERGKERETCSALPLNKRIPLRGIFIPLQIQFAWRDIYKKISVSLNIVVVHILY
jgi:hypothetical protein